MVLHEHKTSDQYGELVFGSVIVEGFMRRIVSVIKPILDEEPDDVRREYRHLYLDGRLDSDIARGPTGFQLFGEIPD